MGLDNSNYRNFLKERKKKSNKKNFFNKKKKEKGIKN